MNKLLACLFLSIVISPLSYGSDLMDIYHQALDNDPIFKQAYSTYMSVTESVPQARAALYPQLTFNSQMSRTYQAVTVSPINDNGTYDSHQWQVNASQAVFNYQAWSKVQQAKANVRAALATYNDASQDLVVRTAKAYFDVLLAKDTLDFAEAKKRANKRQLDQASERFKVGLDAITSVYEAQAAYDQSVSEVISAQNNQINQNENLRKLTNHVYDALAPLRNSQIPLIHPEPNRVADWIDAGLKQNYKFFATKYSLEAARDNIKAQAAGNAPTLAIQGNSSDLHNDVRTGNFFAPNRQALSSVVLNLNFPILQGGLVRANTRKAQFDYQTASEQMEKAYRDVIVDTRIAFNNISDGISKVKADRQTIISRVNSLESTEAQFQVGTRTMVDVVNAQQQLFETQRQLASDQYNLILSILNLKYLTGSLNVNDLEEVNAWLNTTRIASCPPKTKCCRRKVFKKPTYVYK